MCVPCPAGLACPSGSDPSLNVPCSLGYYSVEGDTLCIACLAGSACPNTTLAEIESCQHGTFSLTASTKCSPCPAGWQCPYTDGHGNTPCALVSVHV